MGDQDISSLPMPAGREVDSLSAKPPSSLHRRQALWLAILLVLATLALYIRVIRYPFCSYDDSVYVTANSHIQAGLNWETIKWALGTYDAANWHPVTWLSHALDCQFYYLDPAGHHGTNVILHVLNVLLLFWVLRSATGFVARSAMVAALFALHPLAVESVAWVAERKNLLSMLFFLLALAAYRWYAEQPRVGRYLLCALPFSLGLMSKPQVITLPFLLLLWDYWPLERAALRNLPFASRQNGTGEIFGEQRTTNSQERSSGERRIAQSEWRWLFLEKLPLIALSAASAVVTIKAQRAGGAIATIRFPLSIRLANAALAYARYLEKAVWPSHLAVFYPHPLGAALGWPAVVAAAGLLIITVVVVRARARRYLFVGWFWFLGTLVPMIGLMQVGMQAMADRYAYLPLIGIYLMVCWGAAELSQEWRLPKAVLPAAGTAALLALMIVTSHQIGYWQDNVTLWSHAVQVTRGNYVAEDNLGEVLVDDGKMEEAMPHFFRAVAIFPPDPTANLNIGAYEQTQQNFPAAIAQYKQVLRSTMNPVVRRKALMNMADAYQSLGDAARARECLQAAASIRP